MTGTELRALRVRLGKTQRQFAGWLGVSLRAVHSFEQGWRQTPVHAERQALFLTMLSRRPKKTAANCWTLRGCPPATRAKCPAWELKAGQFCWFINGTICRGTSQPTWKGKMEICRRCKVFRSAVGTAAATRETTRPRPVSPHGGTKRPLAR